MFGMLGNSIVGGLAAGSVVYAAAPALGAAIGSWAPRFLVAALDDGIRFGTYGLVASQLAQRAW